MPFDADLVLHDGTAITGNLSPTSVTRLSGSVALDLRETCAKGLAAVLAVTNIAETGDTLVVTIQESADLSTWVDCAVFPTVTKGTTTLPYTSIRRFTSSLRYVRARIVVTDSDSGGDIVITACYIMLTQYPFLRL